LINFNHLARLAAPGLPAALTLLAVAVGNPPLARADVTIEQTSTFDLSVIKAHSTTTEQITSDKERRDDAFHCEGFMSLLCGNMQSAEIVRLDRSLEWRLEPKKKEYRETPFMTAEQLRAAQAESQAMIEQMKQCSVPRQTAPAPDTSHCELTPPKFEVLQPGLHAALIGHDATLTQLKMTQSCRNPDTGDTCDFVIDMDAWLTQDEIAGLEDRRAFQAAYLRKLGLDPSSVLVQAQMQKFLAPYADALKQIAGKSAAMRGYPLKSAVRISFGGEKCAAAQNRDQGSNSGAADNSAPTGLQSLGTKLVGGLFAKKKSPPADAPADALPGGALGPGMTQAALFSVETTSITPGPIPATQFDVPAGWKLIQPPPPQANKQSTCPKAGE
jgi:hypothetical protein